MSENNKETSEQLGSIMDTLQEINTKLEIHLAEEKIYRPQLLQAIHMLEQSKGVVWVLKLLVYLSGLAWLVSTWLKDHFKW